MAMRQDDVVYFIHADHLGSTSLTTDISGTVVAETRYLPYGEERWITGTLVTDFTFTGQRAEAGFRLMDYNARYYDPGLGRFISADTVVPNPGNPQTLNRYAYVHDNPLRYVDPTGHQVEVVVQYAETCFAGGPCQQLVQQAQALAVQYGPQIAQAVNDFLAIYGPQIPAYFDQVFQFSEQADAASRLAADKGGNTGNADPNDPFRPFRDPGEQYQYQTSGTRYGEEPLLNVNVNGQTKTLRPDNIVKGYLHESKYIDTASEFYSKQIGKIGNQTGLDLHIRTWGNQLQEYSLAAKQGGYEGVKVFVNSQEAVVKAIETYASKFPNVEFIFRPLQ
jgi:RHS repeat-associated protein